MKNLKNIFGNGLACLLAFSAANAADEEANKSTSPVLGGGIRGGVRKLKGTAATNSGVHEERRQLLDPDSQVTNRISIRASYNGALTSYLVTPLMSNYFTGVASEPSYEGLTEFEVEYLDDLVQEPIRKVAIKASAFGNYLIPVPNPSMYYVAGDDCAEPHCSSVGEWWEWKDSKKGVVYYESAKYENKFITIVQESGMEMLGLLTINNSLSLGQAFVKEPIQKGYSIVADPDFWEFSWEYSCRRITDKTLKPETFVMETSSYDGVYDEDSTETRQLKLYECNDSEYTVMVRPVDYGHVDRGYLHLCPEMIETNLQDTSSCTHRSWIPVGDLPDHTWKWISAYDVEEGADSKSAGYLVLKNVN